MPDSLPRNVDSPYLLRYPDISQEHIVFVYAGDIWIRRRDGDAVARRLTTPLGEESFPRFSPDGRWIAFSASYDGGTDIYLMPTEGGEPPRRLTYHPAPDVMVGWYPDGKSVLFASQRRSTRPSFRQLYRVATDSGEVLPLPLRHAEFGAVSPNGEWLAFQTFASAFSTWKRYRGGLSPDIFLYEFATGRICQLTRLAANDTYPMWCGSQRIFFLSDRGEESKFNLWVYDRKTWKSRQVTFFDDWDVRFPTVGASDSASEIVFQKGGQLFVLDIDSERCSQIEINIGTDQNRLRPRRRRVGEQIESFDLSPQGQRAVFAARGKIFTLPATQGFVRQLTQGSAIAERFPSWSPDGSQIAFFSDRSGEYQLFVRAADGSGDELEPLTNFEKGFRYRPFWSPNSRRLAFIDQDSVLFFYDIDTKQHHEVAQLPALAHFHRRRLRFGWSTDDRHIAFSRPVENGHHAIFLFDCDSSRTGENPRRLTSGYFSDHLPVFDPDGDYLYFLTDRALSPQIEDDFGGSWIFADTTRIAAVPLRRGGPSLSPLVNDDEEEHLAEKAPTPVAGIDVDGFESRLEQLATPRAGRYEALQAIPGKLLYLRRDRNGRTSLYVWHRKTGAEQRIAADVDAFEVAPLAEKVLVFRGKRPGHPAGAAILAVEADQDFAPLLPLDELETVVDPKHEWRQIFADAWRQVRDTFHDPCLGGLGWKDQRRRYEGLLKRAAARRDVNYLINEMVGELSASHNFVLGPGEIEKPAAADTGLLGADLAPVDGRYQIVQVLDGGLWNDERRSPLYGLAAGTRLLAVNGVPIDTDQEIWAAFQGLAGKTVHLELELPCGRTRERLVRPLTLLQEQRLRLLAWIEGNRRLVLERTEEQAGYVYLPAMEPWGLTDFVRQLQAQSHLDGIVFDARFNGGGTLFPDRFIELMSRPRVGFQSFRQGPPWQLPELARPLAQVLLINGWTFSYGELLALIFQQLNLGPLIGTRTAGGTLASFGRPPFVDGGKLAVAEVKFTPKFPLVDPEGRGIKPDKGLEISENHTGHVDAQLDKAIEVVSLQLGEEQPKITVSPRYDGIAVGQARERT